MFDNINNLSHYETMSFAVRSILGNDMKRFPTTDLFEQFFNVVEATENEIKAECNLCARRSNHERGMTFIAADLNTTIIFREHVKVLAW